jgi:hypothetical protein
MDSVLMIEPESVPVEPAASSPESEPEEPMLYCPICSSRLCGRKCKLICEKCGYYMSCADYY